MDPSEEIVNEVLQSVTGMYQRGQALIENIEKLLKSETAQKMAQSEIETLQAHERALRRRYRLKEAAEMAGISHTALYQAEQDGRLPSPDYRSNVNGSRKIRAGYTISQINNIRKVFNTLPHRPNDILPAIIGFLNLKGGAWKTTLTWLYSQYLAIAGHRVLLVDTDPQGSLSFLMGYRPDIDVNYADTIAPYMLRDQATLVEEGHSTDAYNSLHYAIKKTYWPNIDLIPSCLELLSMDLEMPRLIAQLDKAYFQRTGQQRKPDHIEFLRKGLEAVGEHYDYILIDGTPSLNLSTMNVITACDITVIPTPAAMPDFASTLQFTSLIKETLEAYKEVNYYPPMPEIAFAITKFSESPYSNWMGDIIRKTFGEAVLSKEALQSDEIGKATNKINSIYEINPSESNNRKRLKKAVDQFNELFSEVSTLADEVCFSELDETEQASVSALSTLMKLEGVL